MRRSRRRRIERSRTRDIRRSCRPRSRIGAERAAGTERIRFAQRNPRSRMLGSGRWADRPHSAPPDAGGVARARSNRHSRRHVSTALAKDAGHRRRPAPTYLARKKRAMPQRAVRWSALSWPQSKRPSRVINRRRLVVAAGTKAARMVHPQRCSVAARARRTRPSARLGRRDRRLGLASMG